MASTIRKYFYDVFIQLGTLSLAVKFPCKVGTIWQSFMKSLQADSKPDLIQGTSYLQDTITDSTVMEFNTANNTFSPKKVQSELFSPQLKYSYTQRKGFGKLVKLTSISPQCLIIGRQVFNQLLRDDDGVETGEMPRQKGED